MVSASWSLGDWYKDQCSESDRRKLLASFQVPDFLHNQLCTDLNGYFGYRSSLKSGDRLEHLSLSSHSTSAEPAAWNH
jgi:hypothetical protein